jgi:outer membrane receptor protein involved in Fe transport
MKLTLTLLFLLGFYGFAYAQSQVSAKILDEQSKGIDGATVSLLSVKDSSLVKVNVTEKSGTVLFEQIKNGSYLLSVSTVGYKKAISKTFDITKDNDRIALPDMHLEHSTSQLNEVNVQAKKPFIEKEIDRIVVNVNSSIVSAGSTALDVLARSPGVLVNQNDDISMKGKQGVIVMIDGKPTNLASTDLADLLRSTPANSIDKIELITNPSAKYDAAGSAGIINIKLKKDQRYGVNGNLSISAGQGVYGKQNAGISLNYRNNNINLFGNYNYAYRENYNHLELDREFFNNNGNLTGAYSQDNYLKLPIHSNLAKAGLDYTPSKNTTIGVVFTGLISQFNPTGTDASDVLDSLRQKTSYFATDSKANNRLNNFAANLNFKHSIDTAGQEITADLDYARYGVNSTQNYITAYYNLDGTPSQPYDILKDFQPGVLNIYSIKADYALPLSKGSKFEAGFKSSYVKANNNLSFYNIVNGNMQFDTTKSNHFIYKENINAAYANYSKSMGKYKVQLGLRAEQTISQGDQVTTNNTFKNSYVQFFPSFFISDKINEQNDLSVSLGRRIDRPTYRQLNPFKFYLDPSTYVEGNPYLGPQTTYNAEVDYTYKQKYIVSFTYSNTADNITSVLFPDPTNSRVTIQSDVNLARNYYYSLSFTVPIDVTKWWTSTNNLNTYYSNYSGNLSNTPLNKGAFAFDANSTNSFNISKKTTAELNGVFTSGNVYGYLYVKHALELSAGLQRTILNGKGTLKFNVSDFLRTNNLVGTTDIDHYSETFHRHIESRVATLAFVYRFGSNKIAPSRRITGGAEDEKKRAG